MTADEIPLTGGRTTRGVFRAGSTVRRPLRPNSSFVHSLLAHLESRGFDAAPRFLGIDATGREILTFISGYVPDNLGEFSDLQLCKAVRLLRALHDATSDCELRGAAEVVCHGDASPCNCVFVDGMPHAFIDFDAAHAGYREEDLGYAAWLWLDIGNSEVTAETQGRRLAFFVSEYDSAHVRDALNAVIAAQTELASRSEAPPSVKRWATECLEWTARNANVLSAASAVICQT